MLVEKKEGVYEAKLDSNLLSEDKFCQLLEYYVQILDTEALFLRRSSYKNGWEFLSKNYMAIFGISVSNWHFDVGYLFKSNVELDSKIERVNMLLANEEEKSLGFILQSKYFEFCKSVDLGIVLELIMHGFLPALDEDALEGSKARGYDTKLKAVHEFFEIEFREFYQANFQKEGMAERLL